MNKIWYLSPSNQGANIGVDGYGSERDQMYLLTDAITPHLDRAGVSYHVADKTASGSARCAQSNEMGAKFHLCLHSNAGGGGKAWGPVGLYYGSEGKAFCEKLVAALLALGQRSNRSTTLSQRKDLLELKCTTAPAALIEVDFHDSSVGVEFITTRRGEIAEAIARCIIEADGKQFVPATGECTDEAVTLGLFPQDTDWASPMTKADAAHLVMRLRAILGKGVQE